MRDKVLLFCFLFLVACDTTEKIVYVEGEPGPTGEKGDQGEIGPKGDSGIAGQDGEDGNTCTIVETYLGAEITCGEDTVVITDGIDGNDAVVEIIDPCGPSGNISYKDEILLRLATGEILAYFEDGNRRYLTSLGPGRYRTTDAQQCFFTITDDLEVIW